MFAAAAAPGDSSTYKTSVSKSNIHTFKAIYTSNTSELYDENIYMNICIETVCFYCVTISIFYSNNCHSTTFQFSIFYMFNQIYTTNSLINICTNAKIETMF